MNEAPVNTCRRVSWSLGQQFTAQLIWDKLSFSLAMPWVSGLLPLCAWLAPWPQCCEPGLAHRYRMHPPAPSTLSACDRWGWGAFTGLFVLVISSLARYLRRSLAYFLIIAVTKCWWWHLPPLAESTQFFTMNYDHLRFGCCSYPIAKPSSSIPVQRTLS